MSRLGSSGPGITVQFDIPTEQLKQNLQTAERLVADTSRRLDQIAKQSRQNMSGMFDESIRQQDAQIQALSQSIQERYFTGKTRSGRSQSFFRSVGFQRPKEIAEDISRAMDEATKLVEPVMFGSGEKSGDAYARGISSSIERKLAAGALKFALIGLADSMLRGVADAIRESRSGEDVALAIAESVNNAMKNIPIVGAFSEVGDAIGNRLGDALTEQLGTHAFAGHTVDQDATDIVGRLRAMATGFGREGLSERDRRRAEFEDQMTALESHQNPMVRDAVAAARAAFTKNEQRKDAEAVRLRELAEGNEANRNWAEGEEYKRTVAARAAAEQRKAQMGLLGAGIEDRQEKLALIRDMMGAMPQLTAASFISTAQTAIGGFRFGQRDSAQILADNTKKMTELQEDANKLLDDIKRLQMEQDALR